MGRGRTPERGRILALGLVLVAAWGLLGFRLFQVQVVRADEYAERALEQRLTKRELAADRGTIFDRAGRELAVTIDGVTVYADPREVTDPEQAADMISSLLGTDRDALLERLTADTSFVFIARQLEFREAELIREMKLPGIHTLTEPKRVYPHRPLAQQVIGLVNVDNVGVEGLEYRYDELLAGRPGWVLMERDPDGRAIPQGRYEVVPAVPGSDLVSTIDLDLQFAADETCRETMLRTGARRCAIVVLDPKTGEVLALSSLPEPDPEGTNPTFNWAIREAYEPGSVQKLITVGAALEEGIVDWNTVFEQVPDRIEVVEGSCENGSDRYGCFRDFAPHEPVDLTVKDIVTRSSNVGTILIEQELGLRRLTEYLHRFGYGERTGIDFSGEATGNLNIDPTCGSCAASAAIGYSVSVTPVQIAAVYGAVANGGTWIAPHLVSEIVDGEGRATATEPETRRVLSDATARTLRLMLESVVDDGTGANAAIEGFRVGGKTGTSRKFSPEQGAYTDDVVASFVGMAPIDDPRLVVAVVVDSPQVGYASGGLAAAPAFASIMEEALYKLGVGPDGP